MAFRFKPTNDISYCVWKTGKLSIRQHVDFLLQWSYWYLRIFLTWKKKVKTLWDCIPELSHHTVHALATRSERPSVSYWLYTVIWNMPLSSKPVCTIWTILWRAKDIRVVHFYITITPPPPTASASRDPSRTKLWITVSTRHTPTFFPWLTALINFSHALTAAFAVSI